MRTIRTSLFMAALFGWVTASVQGATVATAPDAVTVGLGNTVFVDVVGRDFPETQGGGFNLGFDPAVISAVSVSIDDLVWNFFTDTGTIDNNVGTISDVLVAAINVTGSDPSGDFVVATLEFVAVGEGASSLELSESVKNPWASSGVSIEPLFQPGSITVVPVPAALYLFMTGLAALGFTRRRIHVGRSANRQA